MSSGGAPQAAPHARPTSSAAPGSGAPRTWLLVGDRIGDNRQIEALGEGLGWPVERRRVHVLDAYERTKPKVVATLRHLDAGRSDPLEPPWPDLLVTMGRRLSMVALWVAEQSGGRTRTVLLGKPSGLLEHFDLVVPSGESPLPQRANVLATELPLTRVDTAALDRARALWEPRLADLPRPLTALLVGGPTEPFRFGADAAGALADGAARGSTGLFATTSRRTTPEILAALERRLPTGTRIHRWTPTGTDNPYLGLLALADRFVVTADSISMLVEVARLGRPLAIFPLATARPRRTARLTHWAARRLLTSTAEAKPDTKPGGAAEALGMALYRRGLARHARDFGAIHRALLRQGVAVNLGDPFPSEGRRARDELPQVVARVRTLVA